MVCWFDCASNPTYHCFYPKIQKDYPYVTISQLKSRMLLFQKKLDNDKKLSINIKKIEAFFSYTLEKLSRFHPRQYSMSCSFLSVITSIDERLLCQWNSRNFFKIVQSIK